MTNNENKSEERLFSIIVPVYNVEDYVEECIQSIVNQTEQDYELIIIDDGSTDSSGEKCNALAESNSRIKVIHKENNGQLSARRRGLKECKGKYVVFVDSDDYIDSDALEKLKNIFEHNSADIIVYRWKLIDEYGNLIPDKTPPLFPEGPVSKADFVKELLSMTSLNSLCLKACKYSLFDTERSYKEYYNVRHGEDLLQTIPLVVNCSSIYYYPEKIYNYRANQGGITHSFHESIALALNTVAPQLYQAVNSIDMMNEANNKVFFIAYNRMVWNVLLRLFRSNLCIDEQERLFNEITQFEFVRKARSFFFDNKKVFPIYIRMGLEFAYTSWRRSKSYFALINTIRSKAVFLRTVARKGKSFIRK